MQDRLEPAVFGVVWRGFGAAGNHAMIAVAREDPTEEAAIVEMTVDERHHDAVAIDDLAEKDVGAIAADAKDALDVTEQPRASQHAAAEDAQMIGEVVPASEREREAAPITLGAGQLHELGIGGIEIGGRRILALDLRE